MVPDETDRDATLVQLYRQAYSVHCDQLALDVVQQTDELNKQNQKMLIHMTI
jgi:hypothetical protein